MDVVYVVTSLIEILLYVAGLVAGILVRRRDGKAGALVALGFGIQILAVVLGFAEALILPALIHSVQDAGSVQAFALTFAAVLRLLDLATFVLIFLGLLRLVRSRTATNPGVAR